MNTTKPKKEKFKISKKYLFISVLIMLILVVIGCFLVFVQGSENYPYPSSWRVKVTMEEYFKLNDGMNYVEVKEIIGGDCTKISEEILNGTTQKKYGCNAKGDSLHSVLLTFSNNILIKKVDVYKVE